MGIWSGTMEIILSRDKHMEDTSFWKNKRVFITGHTGFKGSWLSLWLHSLGAIITGYALDPPTNPSLFKLCNLDEIIASINADIRDKQALSRVILDTQPEVIFHMAAQPLVRYSYLKPLETYETNVMGTANLYESIRECKSVRAVVNVTSDKCYQNNEWYWGYRESDQLGGYDPYSASKACSELLTASYRNSFFNDSLVALASVRAGNVIGGGDWALDRLVPDCIRSLLNNEPILIRNPNAIRPWQHVLEPLGGYIMLAEQLYKRGKEFAEAWNFGSDDADAKTVEWIVSTMCQKWGGVADFKVIQGNHPHEAQYLKLDCSKAKIKLNWHTKWNVERSIDKVIEWTRAYQHGKNMREVCLSQIECYNS